ncbi:hypothetical protein F0L17_09810 [Streptomyces sp. TRM43335]|uniref:Secreted protein n=1 Tax=Streptomyces taklimakanensis TaxID=2569853 RepID=A0A6G2BAX5_9ACTN|nr:hypothetical protein [Streptomyces taklimakanensis]MTE19417.1 hypothetical protein [Streptomyces taklimakanensis]
MKLKKTLAVSFTAAMLLAGGAASAHAGEAKFSNDAQILPCPNLEVINLLILSSEANNLDCSRNYEEETTIKKTVKVEKDSDIVVAPKQEQGQGQGQGQKAEQGQKQAGEQDQKAGQKAEQETGQKAKLQD